MEQGMQGGGAGLLEQPLEQTPAMKKAGDVSLAKAKEMLVTSLMKFMADPKSYGPLLGKLKNTQDPLEVEIGRNAALMNERAGTQSKDQGFEMPQSAYWAVPDDKQKPGGIAVAIDKQIDMAESAGLASPETRQSRTERAFLIAVEEGLRSECIREGAEGMAAIFERPEGQQPQDQAAAASETMGLLAGARPNADAGAGVMPPQETGRM